MIGVVASALVAGRAVTVEPPSPTLQVESTATDPVRKQVVDTLEVRLKQLRTFWPPRVAVERPIRVELWGTLEEYRSAIAKRGAAIDNPACYFSADGVIVLGFDGRRFDAPLRASRDRADRLRDELRKAERALVEQLQADDERFEREGTSRDERKRLTAERRRAFSRAAAKMQADIAAADRENRAALDEATDRLSAAAAHELFHAYVDACVYPPEKSALPAWLDEGLAQVVEHSQRTATLGPKTLADPTLLARWRDELKRGDAIGLRELLSADAEKFLIHRANPPADAAKFYLASWAVAQKLLNDGKLAPGPELDRFVNQESPDAITRFERWTGTAVNDWQRAHYK
jgi:hypothetical protein